METALSLLLAAWKIISSLWALITHKHAVEEGMGQQQAADMREALNDAQEANKISVAVDALDDAELDHCLRNEQTAHKRMLLDKSDYS